jgi:predicted nucleotidyltransferase
MDSVIAQIHEIVSQYPIERVVLFGSRAGENFTDRSDYDIAIFYQELDAQKKTSLYFEIENVETLKKIDIVWVGNHERPSKQILDSILIGGKIIYERTSGI